MLDQKTTAQAAIDQSVRLPDYFSCQNCIAWKNNYNMCYILQERHVCAKQMLAKALSIGAVQIHLHLVNPPQLGGRL